MTRVRRRLADERYLLYIHHNYHRTRSNLFLVYERNC